MAMMFLQMWPEPWLEAFVEEESSRRATSIAERHRPQAYQGMSCEQCLGYHRLPSGLYVPCQCHGQESQYDVNMGVCLDCSGMMGEHYELFIPGYPVTGDVTRDTPIDCLICACPMPFASNNFAFGYQLSENGSLITCQCEEGHAGALCEYCAAGFYGEPEIIACIYDEFGMDRWDPLTGVCLCRPGEIGEYCEQCAPEYWGLAAAQLCAPYDCAIASEASPYLDGIGNQCARCTPDQWGLASAQASAPCDCYLASEASASLDVIADQYDSAPDLWGLASAQASPPYNCALTPEASQCSDLIGDWYERSAPDYWDFASAEASAPFEYDLASEESHDSTGQYRDELNTWSHQSYELGDWSVLIDSAMEHTDELRTRADNLSAHFYSAASASSPVVQEMGDAEQAAAEAEAAVNNATDTNHQLMQASEAEVIVEQQLESNLSRAEQALSNTARTLSSADDNNSAIELSLPTPGPFTLEDESQEADNVDTTLKRTLEIMSELGTQPSASKETLPTLADEGQKMTPNVDSLLSNKDGMERSIQFTYDQVKAYQIEFEKGRKEAEEKLNKLWDLIEQVSLSIAEEPFITGAAKSTNDGK